MVGFGQPMLNPVCVTDHVKTHRPRVCCVSVSGLLGELEAIVGEDGVDVIRGRLRVSAQGTLGCLAVGFVHELGDGKLTCSVYTKKEIMKEADGV